MTTTEMATRGQRTTAELVALLRARNHLLWITTREEARAESGITDAAVAVQYIPRTWDCAAGILNINGTPERFASPDGTPLSATDIDETLALILARATNPRVKSDRGLWILRDAHEWTTGSIGIKTRRALRNLARRLQVSEPAQAIVILTPSATVPDELAGHATVLDWPLPDRVEIGQILDDVVEVIAETLPDAVPKNGDRESAIDAAVGLSGEEANSCYSKSLVTTRRIDPRLISAEKKRIITRERVLEWYDPIAGGLDAVGGLAGLKSWLIARANAYTPAARQYGLPAPRGLLLVGISGCGKSLFAKAVATHFGVPLLKWDFGALKSKYVGESEANIRRARKVVEAIGRCVVWFDEIEKFISSDASAASDGGVSSDALGFLLTWMQERTGEAFFIATSNDVSKLPPELLRKGRFDEIFSVDTPNETERQEILRAALREYGRNGSAVDAEEVAFATVDYTGAEIANLVPEAMYVAFSDGAREITTADLVSAARNVVPLTKTSAEKVAQFRQWCIGRTRPASATTTTTTTAPRTAARRLDLN